LEVISAIQQHNSPPQLTSTTLNQKF